MELSRKEVRKIADLAQLSYTEEELEAFVPHFREIIDFITQLENLSTEGLEPVQHSLFEAQPEKTYREDEVRPSLSVEIALDNAPDSREGQFRVPKVIE